MKPDASALKRVACIEARSAFELISTDGNYCDVWRAAGMKIQGAQRKHYDLVVKVYREACSFRQIQVLIKEYRIMRAQLEDIVPRTLFTVGKVGGWTTAVVVAESINPWFNIANPVNEVDAIPLLRKLPKAQNQLLRFCHAARKWEYERYPKIIDLYGVDNLVLSTDRQLRYLDSFHVFFYADLLKITDEDGMLKHKIGVSVRRREYLDDMLNEVKKTRVALPN